MKAIANTFFKGFLFVIPVFFTFALVYWVFATAENLFKHFLQFVLPDGWYFTGLGVASAAVMIFCVGLLAQNFVTNYLIKFFEHAVESIPLVKTIYNSARDLLKFFTGDAEEEMSSVVLVEVAKDIKLMGFVTQKDLDFIEQDDEPVLAVYFPLSYQVGGYTAYIPKSRCKLLDIDVKKAMQQVLTAHVTKKH